MYANKASEPLPAAGSAAILDRLEMERRIGGDRQLLHELMGIFEKEYPLLVTELRTGLVSGALPRVQRVAHTLKGMVSIFGGTALYQAANHFSSAGPDR